MEFPMRHLFVFTIAVLACAPSSALAARIFGDIKLDGKPVPAGVTVEIARLKADDPKGKPTPMPADSTATDKFGAYKLTVKEEGKCLLTVVYEKQTLPLEVFSYKEATRYDLILEKKDGKLTIRRK
jgi:hypothetical protein